MSTGTIFYFAIGVFSLMVIGIVLTGLEFRRMTRESSNTKNQVPEGSLATGALPAAATSPAASASR